MFNETVLWQDFRQGDEQAFETIFLYYHADLFQYGSKMVRDRQTLDDCIQELFLELWQSRERLAEVVSIKAYLFKSLKYKLIRVIKSQLKQTQLSADGHEIVEFSYETILIDEEVDTELKEKLLSTIQKLTRRQQEALYLRFYNQMSYEEIGEIMSIGYQAVVNLIYKAIKFLRENMLFLFVSLITSMG